MPKNKKLIRECDISSHCNSLANQYLILVTIFSALLAQEIEDDEELGILGSFLVALGEELALASETRILCKLRLKEELISETQIVDVFDRGLERSKSDKKVKKIKKIKKLRKNSINSDKR